MGPDRRVVLRQQKRAPRWLWLAPACAAYAILTAIAWPLLAQRAYALGATGYGSKPALSSLITVGTALAMFWVVALVAMALCWRRRGIARIAVLAWPLVMLASPEAMQHMPTPWTWMVCLVLGIVGAALIAGPQRDAFGKL